MLDVTKSVRSSFEEFKPKLPLINDLRNPALKKRHWEKIAQIIGDNLKKEIDERYDALLDD